VGLDASGATEVERACRAEAIVEATHLDKKSRAGDVRYVLLAEAGRVARVGDRWSHVVPDGRVLAVLARAREGALDAAHPPPRV
jgi:3-dehydroquinate synthetase